MRKKSQFTPQQKVKMVLESQSYPDGIGAYCRSKGIRDTLLYKWKKQLEERASDVFSPAKKTTAFEAELSSKLTRKDEIISELVSENIDLKKKYGV